MLLRRGCACTWGSSNGAFTSVYFCRVGQPGSPLSINGMLFCPMSISFCPPPPNPTVKVSHGVAHVWSQVGGVLFWEQVSHAALGQAVQGQ